MRTLMIQYVELLMDSTEMRGTTPRIDNESLEGRVKRLYRRTFLKRLRINFDNGLLETVVHLETKLKRMYASKHS